MAAAGTGLPFFLLAFLLVLLETQMPVVYFHLLEPAGSQCIIKIYILTPVKAALLLLYVLILLFYFVEGFFIRDNLISKIYISKHTHYEICSKIYGIDLKN